MQADAIEVDPDDFAGPQERDHDNDGPSEDELRRDGLLA
jgi:hypothetical protein